MSADNGINYLSTEYPLKLPLLIIGGCLIWGVAVMALVWFVIDGLAHLLAQVFMR